MPRRPSARLVALIVVGTSIASACAADPPPSSARAEQAAGFVDEACGVRPELLRRIWRGYRRDRSGDIQLVAREPAFMGGGFSHSGPWDHLQEVPMFLYGPGHVKPGTYRRPVTLADVASTQGELLGFPFPTPDGRPMREALVPAGERDLPRLVVTLVWDSAGINVLKAWPDAWPYLDSLRRDGAWFTRAVVGASPSNTPTGHATLGTGAFPRGNGFVDEFVRLHDVIAKPNALGPALLITPTFADVYDAAMDNEPVVGGIVSLAAHAMMMSHGSLWTGGDRDLAVMREIQDAPTGGAETVHWNLTSAMAPYYSFPAYANELGGIDRFAERLDREDGRLDGRWRDVDIDASLGGFNTPARTPFQTRLIEEVIRREGFGADGTPDLLYLNYKAIDVVGHMVGAEGVEMSDAVRYQDDALREMVRFLNRRVGRGGWVLVLTADHGTQQDPSISGAFQISSGRVEEALIGAFDDDDDVPVIQFLRHTQLWLDRGELAQNGHTIDEVAAFLGRLTKEQTDGGGQSIAPSQRDDEVFEAVFPSRVLDGLSCLPGSDEPPS